MSIGRCSSRKDSALGNGYWCRPLAVQIEYHSLSGQLSAREELVQKLCGVTGSKIIDEKSLRCEGDSDGARLLGCFRLRVFEQFGVELCHAWKAVIVCGGKCSAVLGGFTKNNLPIVVAVTEVEPVAVSSACEQVFMECASCRTAVHAAYKNIAVPAVALPRTIPVLLDTAGARVPVQPVEMIESCHGDDGLGRSDVGRTVKLASDI